MSTFNFFIGDSMELEVKACVVGALLEKGYAGECRKCGKFCVFVGDRLCLECAMKEVGVR